MKKTFSVIILFAGLYILPGKLFAQQDAMFTQYMFNTLAYNPAYAGSRNQIGATALYRNQWTGMAGAPQTATFTVDAPLYQEKVGLGVQFISDKLGVTNTTGGILTAAYRIQMSEDSRIAFGMQGGVSQYNANFSGVQLDPSGLNNDPAFRDDVSIILFNMSTGAYYNTNKFYLGLSVKDLLDNKLNKLSSTSNGETARQSAHAFLASGYVFPIGNDYNLKTAVLLKGVKGAPIEADINATLWIKDFIAVGAGYRTKADVSALLQLRVTPKMRIGYAYDHSTTSLKSYNSGSHEFMLRYEIPLELDKILSPRYF